MDKIVKTYDLHSTESIEFVPPDANLSNILYFLLMLRFRHNLFDGLIQDVIGMSIKQIALALSVPMPLRELLSFQDIHVVLVHF